jgi:hypothetical protein
MRGRLALRAGRRRAESCGSWAAEPRLGRHAGATKELGKIKQCRLFAKGYAARTQLAMRGGHAPLYCPGRPLDCPLGRNPPDRTPSSLGAKVRV